MELAMTLPGLLAFVAFIAYLFYIPLPNDMYCRWIMQIIEPFLRITHEYPARMIEHIFGAEAGNKYTRFVFSLVKIVSPKYPKSLNIVADVYNGVRVRVYTPEQKANNGAILYLHGGGFCVMDPAGYDGFVFALIERLKMTVISVDYRLAPEHKFPSAVDDCEKAAIHLMTKKCQELNVDPRKVVVMGDSAGGNLATVVSQRLKRRTDIKAQFKLQALLYPAIQIIDMKTPSYQQYTTNYNNTALLDPHTMARWMLLYFGIPATRSNIEKMTRNEHLTRAVREKAPFNNYLSHKKLPPSFREGVARNDPRAPDGDSKLSALLEPFLFNPDFSPIMAADLKDLPTAYVATCGWDILRDEAILYVKRLQEHGVTVDWKHYPSAIHAIGILPSPLRTRILDDIGFFVESNL